MYLPGSIAGFVVEANKVYRFKKIRKRRFYAGH